MTAAATRTSGPYIKTGVCGILTKVTQLIIGRRGRTLEDNVMGLLLVGAQLVWQRFNDQIVTNAALL